MGTEIDNATHIPAGSPEARELAASLRTRPEGERFEFIQCLLPRHPVLALQLANASLRERCHFESLLQQGLKTADASSIQFWLEAIVPRLGARRVLSTLESTVETDPDAVDKALYWLPRFLPKEDAEARMQMKQLVQQLKTEHAETRSDVEPISAAV